ncbi:MAG: nucleotidyltransferase domain-containing protein [Synergistaceae bacterium]|nr:nucleotidyltransferase domain-containing protein [Synergistaceae bacterium]
MEKMFEELVNGILAFMGRQVVRIILYGSVARGTDTPESDIDIALIIRGSMDTDTESRLSRFTTDMNLKYEKVFSIIDIDEAFFLKWKRAMPFCRNVEQEGVVLWKAA